MSRRFYAFSACLANMLGYWSFGLLAWFVATGYFLFFPCRVARSLRFYRVLFPGQSWIYHFWCAWRQFHQFTTVFRDRLFLQNNREILYTSRGWEHLKRALKERTGGIILMSHLGNWELAAHLLKKEREDLSLLLFMGKKEREQIEDMQKKSLLDQGIRVLAPEPGGSSSLDIIEGLRFLESGGFVSLTGDRMPSPRQRNVPVKFLGYRVYLPEMPYVLALASRSPIFVLFALRNHSGGYEFSVTAPICVSANSKQEKSRAIQKAAQEYADLLEKTVYQNPFQWYHFEDFWDLDN